MGCTTNYLKELPCDWPFTHSVNGQCDLLIETRIFRNGMSRAIFTTYATLIALVSLGMTSLRLKEIWEASPVKKGGGTGALGRFAQLPSTQMYFGALWAFFFQALASVDIQGMGGRLPVVFKDVLYDWVAFGMLVVLASASHAWYNILHHGVAVKARKGCAKYDLLPRTKAAILVMDFLALTVLPILIAEMRPDDASLGVYNGRLSALKSVILIGSLVSWILCFTVQYIVIRRRLTKSLARREKQVVAITSVPIDGARQSKTVGDEWTIAETGTTLSASLRGGASKASTFRSLIHSVHSSTSRTVAKARRAPRATASAQKLRKRYQALRKRDEALRKLRKYIVASWLCVVLSSMFLLADMKRKVKDCWVWTRPPRTQWFDALVNLQLAFSVIFVFTTSRGKEMASKADNDVLSGYGGAPGISATRSKPWPSASRPRPTRSRGGGKSSHYESLELSTKQKEQDGAEDAQRGPERGAPVPLPPAKEDCARPASFAKPGGREDSEETLEVAARGRATFKTRVQSFLSPRPAAKAGRRIGKAQNAW